MRSVAEVGCGAGEILRILASQHPNITFHGYEVSPQAFAMCEPRRTANLDFFLADLGATDAFYDALLCMDVVEHVEDYIGFLRALRPRADLKVFNIPLDMNAGAVLRNQPIMHARRLVGHPHYFSRDTALATLEHCGYEILQEECNHPFLDGPRGMRDRVRGLAARLAPHLSVRTLGGSQLLVLAR
jgi:hypothetical protein